MRRVSGELIILWTLPVAAVTWLAAFFLFPGFVPPMSPTASAARVAAFFQDHTDRVRYSMIIFNWFCVALIPLVMLIVEQMRAMAHRTPVMRYCLIGVAGAAPIAFLTSTIFWLLAAFQPDRAPELTQLLNDLAWITFTCGVPFLVAQCAFVAVSIFLDQQVTPVFPHWVGYFNLLVGLALIPAGFAGLAHSGPFAWNGFLAFWVRNVAITLWIVVMAVLLGRNITRDRVASMATA